MDFEDAYGKGYNACHRGAELFQNPYAEGSRWWSEWRKGWNDAFRVMSR